MAYGNRDMSYPPLDYIGYGKNPPNAHWPHQARLAINFVINYEEGAELNILNGDSQSENYLTEITELPARKNDRDPFSESIFEYGARCGIWRLFELFKSYKIPTTLWACGMACEKHPTVIKTFAEEGHEIAGHGYRWFDYHNVDRETEREHIRKTIEIIERLTRQKVHGWYTGRRSSHTRELIMERGILYDSDNYSDDLPFWLLANNKPHLIIPYTLDANDAKYFMSPGWMSGEDFLQYLKNTFDYLYQEGKSKPKMMTVALHARISGRPGRAQIVKKFLDYIMQYKDIWITTRYEIAKFWSEQHPYES